MDNFLTLASELLITIELYKMIEYQIHFFKLIFGLLLLSLHLYSFGQYQVGYKERGLASYYSAKFKGKKTANGEVYLPSKFTAAHRKLPFKTIVRITNRSNGKWVYAKINDRGPFAHKRIIDVSGAIADSLDMKTKGIVDVEIEIMRLPSPAKDRQKPVPKPKPEIKKVPPSKISLKPKLSKWYEPPGTYNLWGAKRNPTGFGVQIGSFTVEKEAKGLGEEALEFGLELIYIHASKVNHQVVYRVLVESYKTRSEAEVGLVKIKRRGFFKAFVREY